MDEEPSDGGSPKAAAKVRIPPPVVFATGLGAGVLGRMLLAVPLVGPRALWLVVGATAVILGLGLVIWARRSLEHSGQDPKPWTPSPHLLDGGPYAWSRNPLYCGAAVVTLGIGLMLGDVWPLVGGLVAAYVVQRTAIVPEEAYLRERFGDAYATYCDRVRRWL